MTHICSSQYEYSIFKLYNTNIKLIIYRKFEIIIQSPHKTKCNVTCHNDTYLILKVYGLCIYQWVRSRVSQLESEDYWLMMAPDSVQSK